MGAAVSNGCWTLEQASANLQGALCGRIDLKRPHAGLHSIKLGDLHVTGDVLRISRDMGQPSETSWPLPLGDAYLRGNDLVATYESVADWPYRPQVYWSGGELDGHDGRATSIAVTISLQTDLLDTWPRIHVSSTIGTEHPLLIEWRDAGNVRVCEIDGARTIRPAARVTCILQRLAGHQRSYIELMLGSDFREVRMQATSGWQTNWLLFSDFLEKGVICKSRLQCAFVAREGDIDHAAEYCAAMAQLALPLTT